MDTRNKRASVLGLALASLLVLPEPTTTSGAAQRQHLTYCYAGISAGTAVSGTATVAAQPASADATGTLTATGTGAVTAQPATAAATGTIDLGTVTGTAAVTARPATVSATGLVEELGSESGYVVDVAGRGPEVRETDGYGPYVTLTGITAL